MIRYECDEEYYSNWFRVEVDEWRTVFIMAEDEHDEHAKELASIVEQALVERT